MLDVLTIGRVGVDIYPLQVATPLAEVETFGRFLGGSPTNVAVAASRYGLPPPAGPAPTQPRCHWRAVDPAACQWRDCTRWREPQLGEHGSRPYG